MKSDSFLLHARCRTRYFYKHGFFLVLGQTVCSDKRRFFLSRMELEGFFNPFFRVDSNGLFDLGPMMICKILALWIFWISLYKHCEDRLLLNKKMKRKIYLCLFRDIISSPTFHPDPSIPTPSETIDVTPKIASAPSAPRNWRHQFLPPIRIPVMEMLLPPPMNSSPDPASVVAIFELELHASVRQRRWIGQGWRGSVGLHPRWAIFHSTGLSVYLALSFIWLDFSSFSS